MNIDVIVDFVSTFTKEENTYPEKVIEYFHALKAKDKQAINKRLKTRQKAENGDADAIKMLMYGDKESEYEIEHFEDDNEDVEKVGWGS